MYDALLDPELDDDNTQSRSRVDDDFEGDGLDEDMEDLIDDDVEKSDDEDSDSSEDVLELLETGEDESWSDDPVRMYLTQMGEIPLLTRREEISLAKRIEITRTAFRGMLLECDYVIRQAYKVLSCVHRGELPFDRTVQVSVTDRLEKDQILGRMPHNLRTIEILLES